jgi:hypothetical protein
MGKMTSIQSQCIPDVFQEGGIVILGRAATRSNYSGRNLRSLLRFHFLRFCKSQNVRYVVGEVVANAKRNELLKALGYDFFPGYSAESSSFVRSQEMNFLLLDLRYRYEQAMAILSSRIAEVANEFPWSGPEPIFHS